MGPSTTIAYKREEHKPMSYESSIPQTQFGYFCREMTCKHSTTVVDVFEVWNISMFTVDNNYYLGSVRHLSTLSILTICDQKSPYYIFTVLLDISIIDIYI